ncbi:acyl carrier protein [Sporobacter termitidis DSM 10068]|uniref:Acyl carrier protein n=1 Tax=Sporobacter termitidis DSM 10068 TaxID=1123282 RepID=A0A1M5U8B6_9FIRM|nr:acyl carrier protein [Sporobacter termitidis]SHH59282.1 acyl carrier protein [Sporobacter termitidis DSM 10068]
MDEKFVNLIASTLEIPADDLKYDSTTETVPQWTSLSHWEIIEALEAQYGIEFTMDEATEFKNLGELYEILQRKLS